jgi:hypothetical protein
MSRTHTKKRIFEVRSPKKVKMFGVEMLQVGAGKNVEFFTPQEYSQAFRAANGYRHHSSKRLV